MKYPKRSQYKCTKKAYRVRNWRAYEQGLWQRGDLTIRLSEEALKAWRAPASGKPGGQRIYANIAIQTALTVRIVYHLALRQTEGFLRSLASQLELDLPIPDHTTLSRRARKLARIRFAPAAASRPIHILIDSTGLKIHVGNLRKPPKHRDWRKLHVAVDSKSGHVVAAELTSKAAWEGARVPALLKQIESPLASVSADGAYDTESVYRAISTHGAGRPAKIVIPPKRDALLSLDPVLRERNRHIRSVEKVGRRKWQSKSGYSKRSMAENAIYRYKAIIGTDMRSRNLACQRAETKIGWKILNTMTDLGMPQSYRVG